MRVAIERMIDKIMGYYETHYIEFSWEVRESLDKETYKIILFIDYPLCNKIRVTIILFNKNTPIRKIKKDIMNVIDETIKQGASAYGYEINT